MNGADIVAEARSWVGTPYQHQAHLRGVGCDCGGLIGGVAVALGIVAADWWATVFTPHAGYARQPHGDSLVNVLDSFMPRIDPSDICAGCVVAMRFRRDPQHIAIVADHPGGEWSMIHALNAGLRQVVEHRIDARWLKRITHAYTFPGVA